MNEDCYISSKYWHPNKSVDKMFLRKTSYVPPFFQIRICALHRTIFQKHPLFTTFLLVLTVDEVHYISNKYQAPYSLAKRQYFYKRDFISLLHFGKKMMLSIANVFPNIHFLPIFHYFWKWVRFLIFQINADFLINHLQNYFYTKHLRLLLHFRKKFVFSIK